MNQVSEDGDRRDAWPTRRQNKPERPFMSSSAIWLAVSLLTSVYGGRTEEALSPAAPAMAGQKWRNGLWSDPGFFPLAVWLQAPANAERYRQAGFNVYVGLWRGPTEEQLSGLKQAGMRVICGQNEVALRHRDDSTIIGWMHGDEPDNAQSLGEGRGWGAPVLPAKIVAD